MNPITRCLCLFSLLLLAACAAPGPTRTGPVFAKRVGVLNLVEPQLTHAHVGLTAFGNKVERVEPLQLNAPQHMHQRLQADLDKRGIELVELTLPPALAAADESFVSMGWNAYGVRKPYVEALRELIRSSGIDVLLVFETYSRQDPISNSPLVFDGHGLFTRRVVIGEDMAKVFALVWGYALAPETLELLGTAGTRETVSIKAEKLDASSLPRVEAELAPLLDTVVVRMVHELDLRARP